MNGNGDDILSPREMLELAETQEGRQILWSYIVSARISYAMQAIFEMLDIIPEPGMQQKCCQTMFDAVFRVPQEQIFAWCAQVSKWKEEEYHEGGEC
jgi:hypothetical protein